MKATNELTDHAAAVNGTDGREARADRWIAVYTRSRSEKKAAEDLASTLGIKTYVPVQTVWKQWSDRRKKVDVVVIPMVIFVKLTSNKVERENSSEYAKTSPVETSTTEASVTETIRRIKERPLIVRILTAPGSRKPAEIPANQIERLKFMLSEAETPVEFVAGKFKLADTVRVVRGRLAGLVGTVERLPNHQEATSDAKSKLLISLDLLGGALLEIPTSHLELYNVTL